MIKLNESIRYAFSSVEQRKIFLSSLLFFPFIIAIIQGVYSSLIPSENYWTISGGIILGFITFYFRTASVVAIYRNAILDEKQPMRRYFISKGRTWKFMLTTLSVMFIFIVWIIIAVYLFLNQPSIPLLGIINKVLSGILIVSLMIFLLLLSFFWPTIALSQKIHTRSLFQRAGAIFWKLFWGLVVFNALQLALSAILYVGLQRATDLQVLWKILIVFFLTFALQFVDYIFISLRAYFISCYYMDSGLPLTDGKSKPSV